VKKAWRLGRDATRSAAQRSRSEAIERALTFALLGAGGVYLATHLESSLWRIVFSFVATAFIARLAIQLGNVIWPVGPDAAAAVLERRARFDRLVLAAGPWLMLTALFVFHTLLPELDGRDASLPPAVYVVLAIGILLFQLGRRGARLAATAPSHEAGRVRATLQRLSLLIFGFDLPREEVEALAATSFSARQGMIGILGPNGAGKSTLLRMLAGVLDPSAGTIHYSGRLKRRVGHYVSRWIGYLPQEFGLPDHLTAREYLDYFALLYEVGDRQARRERVDRLLTEVGLAERSNEKIGGFSGGMRQRVAVARTLLREPPIIIVDEPTVGLDPRERIRFRNLLTKLAEGRVVLFSTHVVEDVAVSCRRVIVMAAGRICYDGNPDDLAGIAAGKTWEFRIPPGQAFELPSGCKLVDEVPDAGGGTRVRVLSPTRPRADAQAIEPVIEDGYLQLVNWSDG
ncbi:MAG: ATP-binding cassette domain-containing protein, partial [Gammaproteobacteria bacterium]|nr:ATP-binding cassette domain-containing protein [Gammaproteobacteria bacterium]